VRRWIAHCARECFSSGNDLLVMEQKKKNRLILLIGSTMWLAIACVGMSALWKYETTPGMPAEAPRRWPVESTVPRTQDQATLVMLAHPRCPCTRAAIDELASIMTECHDRLTAYVLFFRPAGLSEEWEKTDLWQRAASIPGVIPIVDNDGIEASRFHAATSGQTVLYAADGKLLFSGGITAARGHAGANIGESAIVSLVNTGSSKWDSSLVFGCPLFDSNSECRKNRVVRRALPALP
jgi:hypothetical protein